MSHVQSPERIPGLPNNFPVIRDNDDAVYYKEDAGRLLIGATEREAKPWAMNGIPNEFCFDELAPDYDHFLPSIESAFKRIPPLADIGIKTFFNGPESFTPDQRMQLGPVPGFDNYYIAAGMNTVGIQAAAGIGKVMTEWITEGVPSLDVSDSDIRRNLPFFASKQYLFDRTIESVGAHADIHWPYLHQRDQQALCRRLVASASARFPPERCPADPSRARAKPPAGAFQNDFVQIPNIAGARLPSPQVACDLGSELSPPTADRFI